MKFLFIIILLLLHTNSFCQKGEKIDTVVYDTIRVEQYCEIVNDSIIQELTAYSFFEYGDYNYDELLLFALAWNTGGENYELSKRKNIDFCGRRFDSTTSEIGERLYLYLDDFWSDDILFFHRGDLCLKQKNGNSIYPYYHLTSDKEDVNFDEIAFAQEFRKKDGIDKKKLIEFCRKYKQIELVFEDRGLPELEFWDLKKEGGKEEDSYGGWITDEQMRILEDLKAGDTLIFNLTFYANTTNKYVWFPEKVGPLSYEIVE